MSYPDRLLIIASSRYDCLIMRRSLANQFAESNITTINTIEAGLSELNLNSYDTLILEMNSLNDASDEVFSTIEEIIVKRESMLTILLSSALASPEQTAQIESLNSQVRNGRLQTLAKENLYEQSLPDYISRYFAQAADIVPASSPYQSNPDRSTWNDQSDLAGQLAHEINNPLMMITGTAELLLKDRSGLSADVGKKMKIILRSASRIKTALIRLKEQEHSRL